MVSVTAGGQGGRNERRRISHLRAAAVLQNARML